MKNSKGKQVYTVNLMHFPEGKYGVYSDGDGNYSVIRQDGTIAVESIACKKIVLCAYDQRFVLVDKDFQGKVYCDECSS